MRSVRSITVSKIDDAGFTFGKVSFLYSKYCSINITSHFIIDTSNYLEEELDEILRECKNCTNASIRFEDDYCVAGTVDAFYGIPDGLRISIQFNS